MIWMSSPTRSRSRRIGISGEAHGLGAQFADVGGAKHLERGEQRRGREDRRVAHGPAGGAGRGPELRRHLEARLRLMAPPAGQSATARCRNAARARSNRRSRRGRRSDICTSTTRRNRRPSRAAAAAGCRWHAPCRSRRWRPTRCAALRDARAVEGLAGAVLHAGPQHERELVAATRRSSLRCPRCAVFLRRRAAPARSTCRSGSSLCQESWPRMAWRSEENAPASMSTLSRMPTGR